MGKLLFVVAIAVLVFAAVSASAAQFFPMGVWYEGGVGEYRNNLIPADPAEAAKMYQQNFADMAAHGVNAAVVPNTQPDHHKVLLDAAQAAGVKLIVELDKIGGELGAMVRGGMPYSDETVQKTLDTKLKPIMSHPALYGVQLLDEPQPDTYERYAKIETALAKYAPRLQPFSCLIGSGPVEPFCKTTHQSVVAFDFYPVSAGNRPGDRQPMLAFDSGAKAAVQAATKTRTPVWAVIQAHSWGSLRVPTPAELRCMTYLALANGCKGVWWFLYQTETDGKGNVEMDGLVDTNFKEMPDWREVGLLTREIRALTPTLLNLTPADGAAAVQCNATHHLLKDSRGRLYVAVVNTNTIAPQKIKVALNTVNPGANVVRLPASKPDAIMANQLIASLSWEDTLAPGDGAIYRID